MGISLSFALRCRIRAYVGTQLAPTLKPGDVVILDNLSSRESPRAVQILEQ
jgi:hypothetical protein